MADWIWKAYFRQRSRWTRYIQFTGKTRGSDLANNETKTIPGTTSWVAQKFFPQVDRIHEGTETDHDTSYIRDTDSEHHNPNLTNPRNTVYDLRHNPKPNCIDDHHYWWFCNSEKLSHYTLVSSTQHLRKWLSEISQTQFWKQWGTPTAFTKYSEKFPQHETFFCSTSLTTSKIRSKRLLGTKHYYMQLKIIKKLVWVLCGLFEIREQHDEPEDSCGFPSFLRAFPEQPWSLTFLPNCCACGEWKEYCLPTENSSCLEEDYWLFLFSLARTVSATATSRKTQFVWPVWLEMDFPNFEK